MPRPSYRGGQEVHRRGREQNGVTMVEDDFQLLCFDMVSDPSTPGAFMMTEAKGSTNVFTREDKINRVLNNFLFKFGEK